MEEATGQIYKTVKKLVQVEVRHILLPHKPMELQFLGDIDMM